MSGTEVAWAVGEPLLSEEEVVRTVRAALARGGRPDVPLAVTFVAEDFLTEMHGRHFGDPTATDVITFPLGEEGEGPVGELYVSVDRAREAAAARGVTIERELALYVVHGTLHLCGFDDRADEDRRCMRDAEGEVLAGLGYPPDHAPHDV